MLDPHNIMYHFTAACEIILCDIELSQSQGESGTSPLLATKKRYLLRETYCGSVTYSLADYSPKVQPLREDGSLRLRFGLCCRTMYSSNDFAI